MKIEEKYMSRFVYSAPKVRQVYLSEEFMLSLSIGIDKNSYDTDNSTKVKEEQSDWWNENVWNKDWNQSNRYQPFE